VKPSLSQWKEAQGDWGTQQPFVNERHPPNTSPYRRDPGAFSFLRGGL
jgi:hypothetical protein